MTQLAKLREEVCKKYNIGHRQLYNKITKKKVEEKILDNDLALLLLAHEKRVDVTKPRFKVPREKLEALERYLTTVKSTVISSPVSGKFVKTMPRKLEKLYVPGEQYDIWKDLRSILRRAKYKVFVVEPHPNEEIFTLYLDSVPANVSIRILVNQPHGKFMEVARKFVQKFSAEIRQSPDVHDRHIFVDNRAWVIGSSIKDAATKKPTYMIELLNQDPFRSMYESIFSKATVLAP
jgi:hypothetical protein